MTADFSSAIFSDTEASSHNFLTAGTLKLDVGESGSDEIYFEITDIKPGSSILAADWEIYNEGSLDGDVSISTSEIINRENGRTELEIVCGDTSDSTGELGSLARIAVWMDINNDGWNSGDYYIYPSASKLEKVAWSNAADIEYYAIDSFGNKSSDILHTVSAGNSGGHLKILLDFPSGGISDYTVQGDSCNFCIEFILTQVNYDE